LRLEELFGCIWNKFLGVFFSKNLHCSISFSMFQSFFQFLVSSA
jgi:hypothetical protein